MRNRILRCGAFLAVLMVLLVVAGLLFLPKDTTYDAGMPKLDANGVLGEPANTLDVIFLGDSEAYCAFIPLRIWENSGIASYVVSTMGQKNYETPEYLHRAFSRQSPKIVVLDTNVLYQSDAKTELVNYAAEAAMPLIRYHDRWKSLNANDWFHLPEYTGQIRDRGYHHRYDVEPASTEEYMIYDDGQEPLPGTSKLVLRYMKYYCEHHGAKLLLVTTPNTLNWDYCRHNAMEAAAQELGLEYLDMNLMTEEIPIDWNTDTLDEGDHLNYFGAVKVSDYMTGYLIKTGLFEDKRQDEQYSRWNKNVRSFHRVLKKAELPNPPYNG